jgi:4'-phosphopantetheinyl transferase EntD
MLYERPVDPIAVLTKSLAEPAIFIEHRLIANGDEEALLPEEAIYFRNAISKVRRESGAARIAARALLGRLNYSDVAITKTPFGAPVWPPGIVGSLAHDERVAIAAVARKTEFLAVGIDIEPADDLPEGLAELIATPAEQSRYGHSFLRGRQLFAAKEAVYKAVHPLDKVFLDFHDIEVNLERRMASISYGRTVSVNVSTAHHVIALAFLKN